MRRGTRSKETIFVVDFDSDEALEAILRRELIEIACFNGVSDPGNPPRHPVHSFAAGQINTVNTSPSVVLPAGVGDRERGDNDLKIFECGNARTTLARHVRG